MPLFRGATSKAILAHLPRDRLNEVAQRHVEELGAARLPASGEALGSAMARQRAAGVCFTRDEVSRGTQAWAVPIHHGRKLLGSMSLVYATPGGPANPKAAVDALVRAGLRVEGRLAPQRHSV